jgi:5-methylcytosine-specific restriction protein B
MSRQTDEDRPKETQDLPPDVEEHCDLLLGEKQIIFAGPPGTSKTYEAFEIISALNRTYEQGEDPTEVIGGARFSGDPVAQPTTDVVWDIVQFHQSYGYEDFVSGIEADTVSAEEGRKQLTFDREKRIFLQLVEAAQSSDVPHVLIIDEINRGALGRVFGELILTLEYRNLPVRLPGQNETIEIPENLHLIGTMNTADRNISLVDHALRRRFHFVERLPEAGQLKRYLQQEDIEDAELMLEAFQAVQSAFTGEDGEYADDARGYSLKDYAVGHTYFMVQSPEKLWRNLTRQVIPLLEEYQKEGILTAEHLRKAARNLTEVISGKGPPPELIDWCGRYRK